MMEKQINVVILAAGQGTRMKSKYAKVLHRAGGLTLVEHVVNAAAAITAPERIVVVVGHQGEAVKAALAHTAVCFAVQSEQKGTGHALLMCRDLCPAEGLLVVLYGDCPLLSADSLRTLVDMHQTSGAAATLIATRLDDPAGYGRVIVDANGSVEAIVEQKAATAEQLQVSLINSGIYCFRADLLWKSIGEIRPDNPANEYYLTGIVEIFRRAGHKTAVFEMKDPGELLGINTRVELAAADKLFRERKVRELMLAGVTIERPETVTIDAQVRIGMDTIVEPFARILGKTAIGEDCRIGACSVIENSTLADGVAIAGLTMVADSTVGAGAKVGPYSRLRMENEVGPGCHIGNFVELKKTRLMAGVKANHLAYLGDSEIGAKTNIGAGTITCNYDGVHKHKTEIGEGVFIGSNATLVAPIHIGDGSYVGAGSVITHPVPVDALAVGRGRQVNKEHWAERRREKMGK